MTIIMKGMDIKNAIHRECKALREQISIRATHDSMQSIKDVVAMAEKLARYDDMYREVNSNRDYEIIEHVTEYEPLDGSLT